VPTTIRFLEQLPYNETGKLLRRLVKQEFASQ
jgi:acyl-coenzyme A synthetase/AMP-(fatty) acid ligase